MFTKLRRSVSRKSLLLTTLLALSLMILVKAAPVLATAGVWSNSGSIIYYNDGRVGLGTSSPGSKLHLKDDGGVLNLEGTVTDFVQWYPYTTGNQRAAWMGFGSTSNADFTISQEWTNANIVFKTNGGNVLVDTILKAKQVHVKSNVWADYVFDSNYKLLTIPELKAFIEKNNHLPNIPTTTEVQADGLSLGDMQAKQMEKIEELTLYTIQQDEKITNQNKQLQDQKEMINDLATRLSKLEQK